MARSLPGPTFDNHLLMMQSALSGRGVALGWVGTASDFLRQEQLVKVLDAPIILKEGLHVVVRRQRDRRIERFPDWSTERARSEKDALAQPLRAGPS